MNTDKRSVKPSTVSFAIRHREGITFPNGTYQSARTYLDFQIDGASLHDLFKYDLVSCLCKDWLTNEHAVNRLLLKVPADFPNNRRSLYVCAECGGLDCGAVSVVIEARDNLIEWREFGYENSWEHQVHFPQHLAIGAFHFDRQDYEQCLLGGLELLQNAK